VTLWENLYRRIGMIVYLNGQYVAAADAKISIWDGGYLYGDGIYTTLRLYQGRPLDLEAHHSRLRTHASELDLPVPLSEKQLRQAAGELARVNGLAEVDGRLRITISRGGSPTAPLPVAGLKDIPPTILLTLVPIGPDHERWQSDGIPVITLGESHARGNFPALKTLNSLATVRALRRAAAAGCPEAILTGPEGRLLEGAVSNLFLVSEERLLTPAIDGGFLAGRTRERILGIAAAEEIEVGEMELDRSHLAAADEVFVASSVREVLPVVSIDGHPVSDRKPGPVTRLIQSRYRESVLAALRDT
jgi:branched-subunit amino acid aminotransferase/4-amino-4-deoxychorismate lyase